MIKKKRKKKSAFPFQRLRPAVESADRSVAMELRMSFSDSARRRRGQLSSLWTPMYMHESHYATKPACAATNKRQRIRTNQRHKLCSAFRFNSVSASDRPVHAGTELLVGPVGRRRWGGLRRAEVLEAGAGDGFPKNNKTTKKRVTGNQQKMQKSTATDWTRRRGK